MDVRAIAEYMIKEGIKYTIEDNYIFDVNEIATYFKIANEEIQKNIERILIQLNSMKEVAECSYESNDTFYITFYTGFCN